MRNKWSTEEIAELARLRTKRVKPLEITHLLNQKFWEDKPVRTPTAVIRFCENNGLNLTKCREIAGKLPRITETEIPIFLDKKEAENIDWREWFGNLKQRQKLHQRTSSSQDEATIKFDDNKKVAICFSADWHTGAVSIDYEEMQFNLETILHTDRVYMVTVGDLINNFRKFYSLQPILSQIVSPREQGIILQSILDEFWKKKKWIAACWGNHDIERDEKLYGESSIKNMLSKNLVYFNGKGMLKLIVGEQIYRIKMSHKFKGYSMYNPNHSQNRELKWNSPDADVIVSAHFHQPACQNFYEYGKPKCLIQTGTFQVDEGFYKRHYVKGTIGVPTVVFQPDKHYCFVYPSLNELLEGFNK